MGRLTLAVLLLHAFCGILQVRGQVTKPNCVIKSADVAFVIDASGSVASAEWKQALNFASNLVSSYDVGPKKVRVGLIVFSNTAKVVFDFNKFSTAAQINAAIASAPKESQSTYTHVALDLARTQLFQTKSGMRPGVPNLMIVITDGQSTVKASTLASAKAAHQAGINVVAVGVKGAALDELKGIASKPNFVYTYGDFNKLLALQNTFNQEICKETVKLAPTKPPPPPPTTEKPCVVKSADIAFILDGSGSVGSTEWTQSLVFARNIVAGYDIGANKVKVAMMEFSAAPRILFDFNKYTNKAALQSAISAAKKTSGGTATSKALDLARTTLFKPNRGMRAGVPNLVFVITDGKSNDAAQTLKSAAALHKSQVTVFAIGVKGANLKELQGIASANNLVYNYQDYNKLAAIQDKFNKEACKVAVKLTAAPPVPTKPNPFAGCSIYNADILFVVDTSSSVGLANFNLTKRFLHDMLDQMNFGKIRVGVLQFNDQVKTVFELNQNNALAQAQASVDRMVYDKGPSTKISDAVKHMREVSFTAAKGDRANAPNLAIIMTDGQAKDPYRTQYEGNLAKKAGIEIFAVGVGNDIDKSELDSLASSPSFVYTVKNYASLNSIRSALATKLCKGFTLPPTTTLAPCICKDKEKGCHEYGTKICYEPFYRAFAKETCPVFCDLCEPRCRKVIPPPRKCQDEIPDCASRTNVCSNQNYRKFALENCAKFCKLCAFINPTRYTQTTPKPTTPKVTKPPGPTQPPKPPKPTKFTPCDPNCFDKERDCDGYNFDNCKRKDYEAFFKQNCAEYCGFCTPIAKCRQAPGTCADKQDCSGYSDSACVDYPNWAQTSCRKRCGLCPGDTPVVKPTVSTKCEDKEDCSRFGNDVCTDYPEYSKTNCRLFCKICVPVGGYTTEVCRDKIQCGNYKKEDCVNPDYRKYMLANCRVFCNLCGVEN